MHTEMDCVQRGSNSNMISQCLSLAQSKAAEHAIRFLAERPSRGVASHGDMLLPASRFE